MAEDDKCKCGHLKHHHFELSGGCFFNATAACKCESYTPAAGGEGVKEDLRDFYKAENDNLKDQLTALRLERDSLRIELQTIQHQCESALLRKDGV